MQRKGLIIRAGLIMFLASLILVLFRGKPYMQLMLSPKYIFFFIGSMTAITLLVIKKVSNPVRIIFLIGFFYLFGVVMEIHPSPLCALTKAPLRYHLGGFIPPPMMVMAAAMVLLTVTGNKIFCGWICPLGCLQEGAFMASTGLRKIKCSFFTTNAIRASLFGLFIICLFSLSTNIYDLFNPFELFHWHLTTQIIIIISLVTLASLVYFRPFCQFLCPAGLITWFFEYISLAAIRKNEKRCTNCGTCMKESPCNAIEGIMKNKNIVADCFACGACMRSCPEDALTFSLR